MGTITKHLDPHPDQANFVGVWFSMELSALEYQGLMHLLRDTKVNGRRAKRDLAGTLLKGIQLTRITTVAEGTDGDSED